MMLNDLEIRSISKTDSVEAFGDFIRELIEENAYILMDKKPTMNEEREWFLSKLKATKNKNEILLCAWDGKKHVGNCNAIRGRWKESGNVSIGIAILKKYRGKGLGKN